MCQSTKLTQLPRNQTNALLLVTVFFAAPKCLELEHGIAKHVLVNTQLTT